MPVRNKLRRQSGARFDICSLQKTAWAPRCGKCRRRPKPVWGAAPPRPYDPATLDRFVTAIRERMRSA